MLCVAEVKCYLCSRQCGEVRTQSPQELSPQGIGPVASGDPCGLDSRRHLRCSRCGRNVYLGDMECLFTYESDPAARYRKLAA